MIDRERGGRESKRERERKKEREIDIYIEREER